MEEQDHPRVHVVMLPFFAQGHVKPMLRLAQLLCLTTNFHITFVNSDHIHDRLHRSTDMDTFLNTNQNLHFTSIPDGLPPDHPRTGVSALGEMLFSPRARPTAMSKFRQLLVDMAKDEEEVTCIVVDGIMSFAVDVGQELGIPVIAFQAFSASYAWIYFHLSKLAMAGILPLQANEIDKPISCILGLEGHIRHRDLPDICKLEVDDPIVQFFIKMAQASILILNTFNELEARVISELNSLFTKVYTIGPLHALSNNLVPSSLATISFNGSLWKEEKGCINWLDSHSPRSVIYVSFGSLTVLSHDQLLEFLHGLVNSEKPFLWVMRPDMIEKEKGFGFIPLELEKGIKKHGYIAEWTPQEEVLSHPAIGGFLTHGGWNSVLESISVGVPMICWPFIGEHRLNSRLVSHVWTIGYDMEDECNRLTIEKMVRELMEERREEIIRNMDFISTKAQESVKEGGASRLNLEKLISDIRLMKSRVK